MTSGFTAVQQGVKGHDEEHHEQTEQRDHDLAVMTNQADDIVDRSFGPVGFFRFAETISFNFAIPLRTE